MCLRCLKKVPRDYPLNGAETWRFSSHGIRKIRKNIQVYHIKNSSKCGYLEPMGDPCFDWSLLVSRVVTYLGDVYPTYLYRGEIIYLLSTMDIPVGLVLEDWPSKRWYIIHPLDLVVLDLKIFVFRSRPTRLDTNQQINSSIIGSCKLFSPKDWNSYRIRGHFDTFLPWFWKYNFSWSNSSWVWKWFFGTRLCVRTVVSKLKSFSELEYLQRKTSLLLVVLLASIHSLLAIINLFNWLVVEPTHLKNMLAKLEIFPNLRGEKKIFETTT